MSLTCMQVPLPTIRSTISTALCQSTRVKPTGRKLRKVSSMPARCDATSMYTRTCTTINVRMSRVSESAMRQSLQLSLMVLLWFLPSWRLHVSSLISCMSSTYLSSCLTLICLTYAHLHSTDRTHLPADILQQSSL